MGGDAEKDCDHLTTFRFPLLWGVLLGRYRKQVGRPFGGDPDWKSQKGRYQARRGARFVSNLEISKASSLPLRLVNKAAVSKERKTEGEEVKEAC